MPTPTAATPGVLRGAHFTVEWKPDVASDDDARRVLERGEAALTKLRDVLGGGEERVPKNAAFTVRLAGEGGNDKAPTVDPSSGVIILYRYPGGASGAYEAPLAHELVHALRIKRWTDPAQQTQAGLFFEEGFAEIAATEAGFRSAGFPLYGTAPDAAGASFLLRGDAIPITKLITEHKSTNFRCMAQSYVERISFMTYLRDRFGMPKLVALAYQSEPLQPEHLEKAFDAKLTALAADHDKTVRARFESDPSKPKAFRETSPIRFFPTCSP